MTAVIAPLLGKDFKLHMGDGAASETYYPLEGFRGTSFKVNNGEIDVTTKDGSRFRKLVAGGIISIDASGSGVLGDEPMVKYLIYKILTTVGGYKGNFKAVLGDGTTYTGKFFAKAVSFEGPHDKEMTYSLDLASADDITLALPAPTVTSCTPGTGVAAGSTAVAIVGTGFQFGATVKFGTTVATSVVVVDGTHITAVSPAHTAATVDVVVTNPDAQVGTGTGLFIYT